jgi:hypothetical protein
LPARPQPVDQPYGVIVDQALQFGFCFHSLGELGGQSRLAVLKRAEMALGVRDAPADVDESRPRRWQASGGKGDERVHANTARSTV